MFDYLFLFFLQLNYPHLSERPGQGADAAAGGGTLRDSACEVRRSTFGQTKDFVQYIHRLSDNFLVTFGLTHSFLDFVWATKGHNIATISWALLVVWVAPFRHSTHLVLAWFTISPWPNIGTFLLTKSFMGLNLIKLFRRNQGVHLPKQIFLHIKSFLSFIMQLDYWDSCSWTWP